MNNKDFVPIEIDLGIKRKKELNESWLAMFGGWIKTILGRMFGYNNTPVTIRGNKEEIESFSNVLQKEKRYLEMYKKYGLDNEVILKDKDKLKKAVEQFEKTTGLIWPFK